MRPVLGLFGLLLINAPLYAATSQYPCQNALYYARDVTQRDEVLICHTEQQRYSLLYGPVSDPSTYVDVVLPEPQLTATRDSPGRCKLTFNAPPYRWVLTTQDKAEPIKTPDTLELYQGNTWQKTLTLSQTIKVVFLRELRQVREKCE